MPSYPHEALLLLFRNNSKLASDLLQDVQAEVPKYTEVRIESADLTDLKPAEYRADMVLLLLREKEPVLGIIVEVQLSVDQEKRYVWPAYVANLRARIGCPVCLLVITEEERVASWAARPIELGGDSRITPWVLAPSNTPAITDLQQAESNVELAVLSARAHANDTDIQRAVHIASVAITASAGLDAERAKLYVDLILKSLSEDAQRALGAMNPVVHEYMSDFARRYVAEGKAEGKVEGKAEGKAEGRTEVILRLLTLRFGPLPEAIQSRIRDVCHSQSESVPDRILMARTLEEAVSC